MAIEVDPRVLELRRRLRGEAMGELTEAIFDLDPEFGQLFFDYVWRGMYPREVLPQKVRELCACAALALLGKSDQLYGHLQSAVRVGATREEALEVMLQMVIYGGFPTTLTALKTYRQAMADLEKEGVLQPRPEKPRAGVRETGPAAADEAFRQRLAERVQKGIARGDALFGKGYPESLVESMNGWSPGFGELCMGFIYGGMYDRAVLSQKVRELCAVAACVVANALPQLDTHTKAAMRMGATRDEVFEVILQMSVYCGMPYFLQAARRFEQLAATWSPKKE